MVTFRLVELFLKAEAMRVSFSARNPDEFHQEVWQQIGSVYHLDNYESVLKLPHSLARGWVRRLKLRQGLELKVHNLEFQEPLVFESTNPPDCQWMGLGFYLAGHIRGTIQGVREDLSVSSGKSWLTFTPASQGTLEHSVGNPIIYVLLSIEAATFSTLVGEQLNWVSGELKQIVEGNYQGLYLQQGRTTQAMNLATQQILNCSYQGLSRRLYLESKAIELIALYFEQVLLNTSSPNKVPTLKPGDVDLIHWAKEILLSDLRHPPSLLALAKQVGLNDCTLKRGFRQVFGTTVFGCLHQQRMERARLLLETGNLSVTQVAKAVGYASLSAFNIAFRKKFGTNPSVYKFGDRSS